jgi:hypothetical protein
MPELYKAIYKAALNQDQDALNKALELEGASLSIQCKVNLTLHTPISQLAYEGNTNAVNFLLRNKASIDEATFGYALGNHGTLVNILLDSQRASITAAGLGYAHADNTAGMQDLIKNCRYPKLEAAHAYQQAGNHYQARIMKLLHKIDELEGHGENLLQKGEELRGQRVIDTAIKIRDYMDAYLNKHMDAKTLSPILHELIKTSKKDMGDDRKFKDIIAHIAFALTGIGLIVMIGKKILSESKSGFLNSTRQQKMLDKIDEDAKDIIKKSPGLSGNKYKSE